MKLKRRIAFAMAVIMLLQLAPISAFAETSVAQGSDLTGHWAKKVMERWIANGQLAGYGNNTYKPNGLVTRAEFITMVNKSMGYDAAMPIKDSYKDLQKNAWYYPQFAIALDAGYIAGDTGQMLHPNRSITRAEAISIVAKVSQASGSFDLAKVKDQAAIPTWARKNAEIVLSNGFIGGFEGNIMPQKTLTRAEGVTMLDNLSNNNRVIAFAGEYKLGQVNDLTIASNDVKLMDTLVLGDVIIAPNVQGSMDLGNIEIKGSILSSNKELKLIHNGITMQSVDGKMVPAQGENKLYKDGVFEGSARGYGGDIKVKVTLQGDKITHVEVLDNKEDKIYMKAAMKVIPKILEKQTTEVDTSSGATISSKGILFAVEDALKKALLNPLELKAEGNYKDGEYIGEANGFSGRVKVKVLIEKGLIKEITVVGHSDDYSYMESAKNLLTQIKDKQKAEVDSISGATFSSEGIKNAVIDALSQAEGKTHNPGESEASKKNPEGGRGLLPIVAIPPKKTVDFKDLKDGTYEGMATGYYANAWKVRITVENQKLTSIELIHNNDDKAYLGDRWKNILEKIIEKQSTDVDTVSGATASSRGFINAVANAVEKATGSIMTVDKDTDLENKTVKGLIIQKPATVKNAIVDGDLSIEKSVGDGDVRLENVNVKGKTYVYGGGSNTIAMVNSTFKKELIVDKKEGQAPRIVFDETSKAPKKILLLSQGILEGKAFRSITIRDLENQEKIQINGSVGKLLVDTKVGEITIGKDSAIKTLVLPSETTQTETGYAHKNSLQVIISDIEKIEKVQIQPKGNLKVVGNNLQYADGVWDGYGDGYYSDRKMHVQVTVENGKVKSMDIKKFVDDDNFESSAKKYFNEKLAANKENLDQINKYYRALEAYVTINRGGDKLVEEFETVDQIKKEMPDVISGATYSGAGITRALVDALYKSHKAQETGEAVIKSIHIKTMPKTLYLNDEKLDFSNLVITVTRSDNTTQEISYDDFAKNKISISKKTGDSIDVPYLHNERIEIIDEVTKTGTHFDVSKKIGFTKSLNIQKIEYKTYGQEWKTLNPVKTDKDMQTVKPHFSENNLHSKQALNFTDEEKAALNSLEFRIFDENNKEVASTFEKKSWLGKVEYKIIVDQKQMDSITRLEYADYTIVTNVSDSEADSLEKNKLSITPMMVEETQAKAGAKVADFEIQNPGEEAKVMLDQEGADNPYFVVEGKALKISEKAIDGDKDTYPKVNSEQKALKSGKYDVSLYVQDETGATGKTVIAQIIIREQITIPTIESIQYGIGTTAVGWRDSYENLPILEDFDPNNQDQEIVIKTQEEITKGMKINLRFMMAGDKTRLRVVNPENYFLDKNNFKNDPKSEQKFYGTFDKIQKEGYVMKMMFQLEDALGQMHDKEFTVRIIQEEKPVAPIPKIMKVEYYLGERVHGFKGEYNHLTELTGFDAEKDEVVIKTSTKIEKDTTMNLRFTMEDEKGKLQTVTEKESFLRINSFTGNQVGKEQKHFGIFSNSLASNEYVLNLLFRAEEEGERYDKTYTLKIIETAEEPGTENPGTENPGTEDPGTENPGTENPGTEDPGTENPNQPNEGEFRNGEYLGRGQGHYTTADRYIGVNVVVANGKFDQAVITHFGDDTGQFENTSRQLLSYINSQKTPYEVEKQLSTWMNYTENILRYDDKEKAEQYAKTLIGEYANDMAKNMGDYTTRTGYVSNKVKEYLQSQGNPKEVFDTVSGATRSATGISRAIVNALEKSKAAQSNLENIAEFEIKTNPKTEYTVGEKLALDALVIEATRFNGTKETISFQDFEKHGLFVYFDGKIETKLKGGENIDEYETKGGYLIVQTDTALASKRILILVNPVETRMTPIGMEYQIDNGEWTPFTFLNHHPNEEERIDFAQELSLLNTDSGKGLQIRVKFQKPNGEIEYLELSNRRFNQEEGTAITVSETMLMLLVPKNQMDNVKQNSFRVTVTLVEGTSSEEAPNTLSEREDGKEEAAFNAEREDDLLALLENATPEKELVIRFNGDSFEHDLREVAEEDQENPANTDSNE